MPSRGSGSFIWPHLEDMFLVKWEHVGVGHTKVLISHVHLHVRIVAADNGVVTSTGWHGTYGNRVVITHNNGYETLYAHLSSIDVSVGQTVPQGTKIGVMGSTGRSTGVHLHFEVIKNGSNINPMSVLR